MNDEFVFIHEGSAILTVNDQDQLLQEGDSVTIPAGINRRWRNEGQAEVQLLMIPGEATRIEEALIRSPNRGFVIKPRPLIPANCALDTVHCLL